MHACTRVRVWVWVWVRACALACACGVVDLRHPCGQLPLSFLQPVLIPFYPPFFCSVSLSLSPSLSLSLSLSIGVLRSCHVQGNDRGTQYRSGIYARNEEQFKLATASAAAYGAALSKAGGGSGQAITTEIVADTTTPFYFGEDHHMQYLSKPGARQYCSAMPTGVSVPAFESWCPADVSKDQHTPVLPEAYVLIMLRLSHVLPRLAVIYLFFPFFQFFLCRC